MNRQELAGHVSPYAKIHEPASRAMPDWDDFRVLVQVVKLGSFNRAAQATGLTQPTVSRRIAQLEAAMGVRLVDRNVAGATLTLEGQRIFEELSIAHAALERAIDFTGTKRAPREKITLVITDGLAAYWLAYFLPEFYRRHPHIDLCVYTANDSATEKRGHYDLSIHFLAPSELDMVAMRLGTLHFVPYASPSYLAEQGTPASIRDLGNHRLLDFALYLVDKGSWATRLPDKAGQDRTVLVTNSSGVLAESVRRGAGIALLPTYCSLFEEGLVPLEIGLQLETPFWLCYRQEAAPRSAVQNVVAFLRHIFDRRSMPWFGDSFVPPREFPKTSPQAILETLGANGNAHNGARPNGHSKDTIR